VKKHTTTTITCLDPACQHIEIEVGPDRLVQVEEIEDNLSFEESEEESETEEVEDNLSFENCQEPKDYMSPILHIHNPVAVPVDPAVYKNPDLLPELKQKRLWACGRATWNEKRGKWDKKPYIADMLGTNGASHSDPSTWRTFEHAMAVYEKSQSWKGEAEKDRGPFHFLMIACNDSYTFTDYDGCRNPETGEITEEAMTLARAINSYTEPSYSETGIHFLSWGTVPAGRKNGALGVEMYSRTRFCALTGTPLPDFPQTMEQRSEVVNARY
jgi:hypothetical protein